MKLLTFVEIDVDRCSLSYGVYPCQAAIPTTGSRKCFNSLGTCQDRDQFENDPATLRFSEPSAYLPASIDSIPSIESVSFTPGVVSLGQDLGQRATLEVTFIDHRHSDAGLDPYLSDRNYNPYEQGTFWGKFRARNPYLIGRSMRLIRGSNEQILDEMETRHFVIDHFDGPTPDGRFRIVAKDILKLADGDRSQAPVLSNGFLSLAINTSTTSATLAPTGIGNEEYPASGLVAIGGKEICSFTRSGDTLTLTRAQLGTTAVAHSAQDRVQLCLRYVSEDPADIIKDLLVNYANIPEEYVPIAEWLQETESFFQRLFTGTVAEPTSVAKLVSELIEQSASSLWWDDRERELKFRVLRSIQTDSLTLDDDNIIESSLRTREQPDRRLSQVWTYYGQINPLRPQDDPDNYRSAAASVSLQKQTDYGSPGVKKIFSRWIPALGRPIALRLNDILLGRFQDAPRRLNFDLYKYGPEAITLGGGGIIRAHSLQDDTGAREDLPIQITRLDPGADLTRVEAEEMQFAVPDDFNNLVVIIETDTNDFNFRTAYDQIYDEPESGDDVYCVVEEGVVVGSTTTGAAFTVGDWPAGVNLFLEVRGKILGRGGAAGAGAGSSANGAPGQPGGLALYTRYNITIDGEGIIGGGGGGGGGGGVAQGIHGDSHGGGGGGGGRGRLGGAAGPGGPGTVTSGFPGTAGTADAAGTRGLGGVGTNTAPGGNGGDLGQAGSNGSTASGHALDTPGGVGGAAGKAIDGDSYVTLTDVTVYGARIN